MKKLLFIASIILMCDGLFAQDKVDSLKYAYCELIGAEKLMSTKITVSIDFGQATTIFSDKRYKDENGKPIVFNSMVDALNFMGDNGWEFVQAYIVTMGTGGSAQNVYHWLLKKQQ